MDVSIRNKKEWEPRVSPSVFPVFLFVPCSSKSHNRRLLLFRTAVLLLPLAHHGAHRRFTRGIIP